MFFVSVLSFFLILCVFQHTQCSPGKLSSWTDEIWIWNCSFVSKITFYCIQKPLKSSNSNLETLISTTILLYLSVSRYFFLWNQWLQTVKYDNDNLLYFDKDTNEKLLPVCWFVHQRYSEFGQVIGWLISYVIILILERVLFVCNNNVAGQINRLEGVFHLRPCQN